MEASAADGDAAAASPAKDDSRRSTRLVIQEITRQEDQSYQFELEHPYHGVDPGILPSD